MKIIGKIPPEFDLRLGTKSPVRPGRFGFGFGFDFGFGFGFDFGNGYGDGFGFGFDFGSGYGEGSKDIQYEDHR
jgi:hypothetical protein